MSKAYWATTCNTHGTIRARNESVAWVKVSSPKHPKVRDGKTGCPFCIRNLKKEVLIANS
jgi:hypothetical protein